MTMPQMVQSRDTTKRNARCPALKHRWVVHHLHAVFTNAQHNRQSLTATCTGVCVSELSKPQLHVESMQMQYVDTQPYS